jgi:hypothetical protein
VVNLYLNRRQLFYGLALLPQIARAKGYVDLDWADLIPDNKTAGPSILKGFREILDALAATDETNASTAQKVPRGVRSDWNGITVRLPGYVVPIEFSSTGVTEFILVPFFGACVHVPAPPPNQLVFVETERPYDSKGIYEAVNVIGIFNTESTTTQIAEIGYTLLADSIEPYGS